MHSSLRLSAVSVILISFVKEVSGKGNTTSDELWAFILRFLIIFCVYSILFIHAYFSRLL